MSLQNLCRIALAIDDDGAERVQSLIRHGVGVDDQGKLKLKGINAQWHFRFPEYFS
jgi:hypothetical protein